MIVWNPGETLHALRDRVMIAALHYYGFNRTYTARALGISVRSLRLHIHRLGLKNGQK